VDDDRSSSSFRKRFDLDRLRTLDHQVDFEVETHVAQRLTDLWPHRKRRHKLTVHHVDMDDSCASILDQPYLLAQSAEVGGKK